MATGVVCVHTATARHISGPRVFCLAGLASLRSNACVDDVSG